MNQIRRMDQTFNHFVTNRPNYVVNLLDKNGVVKAKWLLGNLNLYLGIYILAEKTIFLKNLKRKRILAGAVRSKTAKT